MQFLQILLIIKYLSILSFNFCLSYYKVFPCHIILSPRVPCSGILISQYGSFVSFSVAGKREMRKKREKEIAKHKKWLRSRVLRSSFPDTSPLDNHHQGTLLVLSFLRLYVFYSLQRISFFFFFFLYFLLLSVPLFRFQGFPTHFLLPFPRGILYSIRWHVHVYV